MSYFRNPETGKIYGKKVAGAAGATFAGAILGSVLVNTTINAVQDEAAKRAFSRQYIVENDCLKDTAYDPNSSDLSVQDLENGHRILNVTPNDGKSPMIHFLILGSFNPDLTPSDQMVSMQTLIQNNCPIPIGS